MNSTLGSVVPLAMFYVYTSAPSAVHPNCEVLRIILVKASVFISEELSCVEAKSNKNFSFCFSFAIGA